MSALPAVRAQPAVLGERSSCSDPCCHCRVLANLWIPLYARVLNVKPRRERADVFSPSSASRNISSHGVCLEGFVHVLPLSLLCTSAVGYFGCLVFEKRPNVNVMCRES